MATEGSGSVARGAGVDGGDGAHHHQRQPPDEDDANGGCSRNSRRQRRLLNWRMDPSESHSDFIIEIVVAGGAVGVEDSSNKENASVDVYHVHKLFLAFGERSSGYFAALIASQTAESMDNKTRIQLDFAPATKAFPILLDYIYGLDHGEPELTIENAGPLYYLADYFEVEVLHPKILGFWKEKMEVDHLEICLKQAGIYHNDSLCKIVVEKCAENIADIAVDSPLLEESDWKFWLAVFEEMGNFALGLHPQWHSLVAEFCVQRKDVLDSKTFKELTSRFSFWIPFDAAMKFLEAEKTIDPSPFLEDGTVSTSQKKMLVILTKDWRLWKKSTSAQELLKEISPVLFSLAMSSALDMAEEEAEAFDAIGERAFGAVPTTISVAGAGIAAVNGVYSRCDEFNPNCLKWVMEGHWDGCNQASFSIHLCPTGPTNVPLWYISVAKAGDEVETDLYKIYPFAHKCLSNLPPMKGWRWLRGESSLPTLTYSFD